MHICFSLLTFGLYFNNEILQTLIKIFRAKSSKPIRIFERIWKTITKLSFSSSKFKRINGITLSVGLGDSPLLNCMIFCVVGKNCEHPVYGDRAVLSVPRFEEWSNATVYSLSPLLEINQDYYLSESIIRVNQSMQDI